MKLQGYGAVIFINDLLAAMPRLGCYIFILVFGESENYIFGVLLISSAHTNHIGEVLVEVNMGLTVRHVGKFHAENPIKGIVAQVGIVAVAAEEEPAVVVLLEIIRMDDEGLRLLHLEALIAQLHGGLLTDGIEERREVLHTFVIDGRLEADGGPHLLAVVHAEVEACAKL